MKEAGLSVMFLRALTGELVRRGASAEEAARALEVQDSELVDFRGRVSHARMQRAIARTAELTGDDALGVSVACNAPESMFQVIAHLITSCRTVGEAMQVLVGRLPLLADQLTLTLTQDDDTARIEFPGMQSTAHHRFTSELVLITIVRFGRHFALSNAPSLVRFKHEAPAYAEIYREVFGCEVRCGEPVDAIEFARHIVDVPQPHADEKLREELSTLASRWVEELGRPRATSERVRMLLEYELDFSQFDRDELAYKLGLTPRALRRRLANEGVNLNEMLDQVRCRLALEELRRATAIKEISHRLGFSETAAFHRAFKRWTGQTPQHFAREAS